VAFFFVAFFLVAFFRAAILGFPPLSITREHGLRPAPSCSCCLRKDTL